MCIPYGFLESAPQQCFSLTIHDHLVGRSTSGGPDFWFRRKTGLAEILYFTEAAGLTVDKQTTP